MILTLFRNIFYFRVGLGSYVFSITILLIFNWNKGLSYEAYLLAVVIFNTNVIL